MQLVITKRFDSVSQNIKNILNALSVNGRNNILKYAGQEFRKMTIANFGSSGDYRDKSWNKLSPKYAKQVGHSNATLIKSGELKDSIKVGTPRSGNFIEIYTNNPYARTHMLGDRNRNIPRRNFWPMEFKNPSYSRLVSKADKEMSTLIHNKLSIMSNGALPRQYSFSRSNIEYGTPFQAK